MKLARNIVLLCVPVIAQAQNYQGMSEADMQNMVQQMQQAQACMAKIDQAELQALEPRSKKFQAEVQSLCAGGQRDQAQQKAIAFGMEIANTPALTQMKKCTEMMKGAMPQMMRQMQLPDPQTDYANKHVCDQ